MRRSLRLVCLALALGAAPLARAETAGLEAVKALGTLNGTALGCGYLELVPRAKGAVIHLAPKTREFGIAFEEATTRAFEATNGGSRACPPPRELRNQVETAVEKLEEIYPKTW